MPLPYLRVVLAFGCFGFCGLLFGADSAVDVDAEVQAALDLDKVAPEQRDARGVALLYTHAAEAGSAVAHWRLGYLYETGNGVPQDYSQARAHYQSAVAGGLEQARLRLAICHLEGWGGPIDRAAFVREVTAAAEAGQAPAQNVLSSLYLIGFGVPLDRAKGMDWLQRAAAQDDSRAQVGLGNQINLLMDDVKLSRSWYQLSAEQEHAEGMRAMARSFLFGKEANRDRELGLKWLKLATETGDPEAPYVLALAQTLPRDATEAQKAEAPENLQLAADRGHFLAKEVLALHQDGASLRDAMMKVLNTPFADRYVEQAKAKADTLTAEGVRPPQVYRIIKPIYPLSLRLTEETGTATIAFVVDTQGRVRRTKVVSATHPLLGERAVEAVSQWKFYPGTKDGRFVNVQMRVPVFFQIDHERIQGVDTMLSQAYDLAVLQGPEIEADARDLRLAKPLNKLTLPSGLVTTTATRVLAVLVLDAQGHPLRGHVLKAEPENVGPAFLEFWLQQTYAPRLEAGRAIGSNVAMAFVGQLPTDPRK